MVPSKSRGAPAAGAVLMGPYLLNNNTATAGSSRSHAAGRAAAGSRSAYVCAGTATPLSPPLSRLLCRADSAEPRWLLVVVVAGFCVLGVRKMFC